MPSAKELKKKIRSIANTRKITRTMEMVASVRAKRTLDSLKAAAEYSAGLCELLRTLSLVDGIEHPLLPPPARPLPPALPERVRAAAKSVGTAVRDRVAKPFAETTGVWEPAAWELPEPEPAAPAGPPPSLLVVITGNRGLCGGYNTNVLALAERYLEAERAAGRETLIVAVGKKGIARFRFRKIPVAEAITSIGDTPTLEEARALCRTIVPRYLSGQVSRVVVVATRYFSSAVQRPVEIELLPFSLERPAILPLQPGGKPVSGRAGEAPELIFEPSRKEVVESLVPLAVEYAVYKILLEARASEHVARRIAMKTATDNADAMIRTCTTAYNRQRQAAITRLIIEVVSGADAID